jgi:uncharacterized membrane protein
MVSFKRHIVKTISYRILSTSVGFITMFFITGSVKVSTAFSLIELIWKPIQYYVHERIWYKYISYGIDNRKKL